MLPHGIDVGFMAVKVHALTRVRMKFVGFEFFPAVLMNASNFWDTPSCNSYVNRRFGGKHYLHFQSLLGRCLITCCILVFCSALIEVLSSIETSVHIRTTRRYIPGDAGNQEWSFFHKMRKGTLNLGLLKNAWQMPNIHITWSVISKRNCIHEDIREEPFPRLLPAIQSATFTSHISRLSWLYKDRSL
jgi:hypothetical protein